MKYIAEEIYHVIPSRYPLMILDSLEICENLATAEVSLRKDLWFFQCHYPSEPMMPLMLLIESMTQVFMAILLDKTSRKDEIPLIYSLSDIVPKGMLTPGDKLTIKATLTSFKKVFAKGLCSAFKNDESNPILEFEIVDILPSKLSKLDA